ncbi:MAG: uracil-DNA glycosylase [Myxococcota bacterium]|jgi:DNA polymerase|nr:uracil-DNA glycosylase [Myxococcota bacterium]
MSSEANNENPGDVRDALRDVVASAREWLVDLAEEGVDDLEVPVVEPSVAFTAPVVEAPAAKPAAAEPPRRTAPERADLSLLREGPDWGANPTLDQVRETLGDCQRCELCARRQTIVFGSGNPDADIMFVGEGPGEQEDKQGLPFVGRAGELLTQMIEKGVEIPRSDVYICNIVKCRPPGNRNPKPEEAAACRPFLDGQIAAVKPKVIVTLGKPAASLLLGRDVAITRVRGTWQDYQGIPLMPTLHPAFILRQYTPENRRLVWEDLKAAVSRMRELGGRS